MEPLSKPDPSQNANCPEPFDGFDDVAEGLEKPHPHPPIPSAYARGTGRRLAASAIILTVAFGGAHIYVNSIKAQEEAGLAAGPEWPDTTARSTHPPRKEGARRLAGSQRMA